MSTLFKGLAEAHRASTSPLSNDIGDGEVFIAQVLGIVKDGGSAGDITLEDVPSAVGTIKFNKATANKKPESSVTNIATPLDRSCYRLSMIGEQVLVVRRGRGYYYFAVVSSFTSMTVNIDPNMFLDAFESAGGPAIAVDPTLERDRFNARNDFDEATVFSSSSLFSRVREGETIMEGRMGGVIKLTHTITKEGVWDAQKQIVNIGQSTDGDPMLVMKSNVRRKLIGNLQYQSNDIVGQIANLTDPSTAASTAKTAVQNPSDQAKLASIAAQLAYSNAQQARGEGGLDQAKKDQLLAEANQIASKEYGLEDDDINEDGSSFYLTTTQVVPLKINSSVSMSSWAVELNKLDSKATADEAAILQSFFPDKFDPNDIVGINVSGLTVSQGGAGGAGGGLVIEGGNWQAIAANYISKNEGFSPAAKWDENTYRGGYGSDKVLKNGVLQTVTATTTFTKEEAIDTLREYSIPRYSQQIVKDLGQANWNKLNDNQKAALTSLAYNVGAYFITARTYGKKIKAFIDNNDFQKAGETIYTDGPKSGAQSGYLPGLERRRREESEMFLTPV